MIVSMAACMTAAATRSEGRALLPEGRALLPFVESVDQNDARGGERHHHHTVHVIGSSVCSGGGLRSEDRASKAWPAVLSKLLGGDAVTVTSKNAVGPDYFLHCSSRFVDPNATDVVLDLGPSLFTPNERASLAVLAARMRALQPHTRVLLLAWPQKGASNEANTRQAIQEAANKSGGTAVLIPHDRLTYADDVHPDAYGHATIARELALALRQPAPSSLHAEADQGALPESRRPAENETCSDAWQMGRLLVPQSLEGGSSAGVGSPAAGSSVGASVPGWKLVDEGVGGVRKLGWRSRQVTPGPPGTSGEEAVPSLRLLLPLSPDAVCGAIVDVAFLRTVERAAFVLACEGSCECAPIRGYWSSTVYPFPLVNATQRTYGGGVPRMKVTMTTSFSVLQLRQRPPDAEGSAGVDVAERMSTTTTPCTLAIEPTEGSVRIDGLYVRTAADADAENAAIVRRDVPATRQFPRGSDQDLQWRFATRATRPCE